MEIEFQVEVFKYRNICTINALHYDKRTLNPDVAKDQKEPRLYTD